MLKGARVQLRPIRREDWALFEKWGQDRGALWGPFQRYQLDHLPILQQAMQQDELLSRESGFLLIETIQDPHVYGLLRSERVPFRS